nr:ribonuclease H-like domain-containing protein [Tanacetum cinerariifolium]
MVCSMWLFKHKFHVDGTLSRYKARLVANSSSQQLDVDFDETFSPVLKSATIRTVLSLVVSRKWLIHQLDIKNAFLNGDFSETVYMHQPPGFVDARFPNHVFHLQRSLYGLKHAPRAWFQRFAGYATWAEFYHSHCESPLFICMHLLIYRDDIILTASSPSLLQQIIDSLHNEFDMTDLGALSYFLGIVADRNSTCLFLSQKKYALQLVERAHMVHCNPSRTPVDTKSKLGPDGVHVQDPTLYRNLAGGYVQICLMSFNMFNFICMIRGSLALLLLSVSCDIFEGMWTLVSTYMLPLLLLWLVILMLIGRVAPLHADNVSVVYMSANLVQHQRTKHIEIDIHFALDMVTAGQVRVLHVPSHYQYTDIFTKGPPSALFEEFRFSLSVHPPSASTAGAY